MTARSALLAWEFGGGRGHVVHFAAIAGALGPLGYRIAIRLAEMEHAAELAPLGADVAAGPALPKLLVLGEKQSSHYGDFLASRRFGDSAVLRDGIAAWRTEIQKLRPDIVVVDNAPVAVLAARSLGVPVVGIGVPVLTPPTEFDRYPAILQGDHANPLFDEEQLCRSVNRAVAPFGLPAVERLPAALAVADQVVASVGLLDPYRSLRAARLVPPVVGAWHEPGERRRDEVFIYLSSLARFDQTTLIAIGALDMPLRVFAAGNPVTTLAALRRAKNIAVEPEAIAASEIARRARVLVHMGQHGMSALGLRAGIVQVTIPVSIEHVFNGRQLLAAGLGRTVEPRSRSVPNIVAAITEGWWSSDMTDRAAAYASEAAPEFEGDPGALTAARIAKVLN